jgi:hypothetical protein
MPSPRPALLRRTVPILALLLAAALPALITAPPASAADAPSAKAIADQVMTAMGGQKAWDDTHYLRFSFAGRRTHYWDKWTGRHRVEGQTREGAPFVVLENVNTKQGKAYMNAQEVTGEQAAKLLELAYGTWINDTYWLLMPYKLQDPGVHLAAGGEDTVDGKKYDKLELTFDHVGLTPGDHYTVWVNHDTHLVDRWAYLLESAKPDEKPTGWTWEGWTTYGKIKLAPHRGMVGGDRSLDLTDLAVFDTLPDAVFDSPAPVAK